jgi:alanyl-tRNA synthetase
MNQTQPLSGNEIRTRFLTFFEKRAHAIVPSAPLVPENDPTVLFNTAGMQPLVPYLMGQPHPTGSKRIANSQKCVRTNDIEEVGDNTHLTFFEMLGNWSLGDYFKKEAIAWSFEFLTSTTEGLGLDPTRLYVTVFEGDENAPRDEEAYSIWKDIFTAQGMDPSKRIFFMPADANWWSPGDNGPCGPDSEMFYDVTGKLVHGLTKEEFLAADDRQDVVEVWNDVFMEYEKTGGVVTGKLASQNVDTGSGLERVTAMVQGVDNVFATDLFTPIIDKLHELKTKDDDRAVRIIADHMRASTFLISDGVTVANTDQGYILRRLLRRSIRQADKLGMPQQSLSQIANVVIEHYGAAYPNLISKESTIVEIINNEEEQFRKTLEKGLREFRKIGLKVVLPVTQKDGKVTQDKTKPVTQERFITGDNAFNLFTTYGFPIELTQEIAAEKGMEVEMKEFNRLMEEHRAKSRIGAEHKFKGGLADHSEKVVHYHSTTHLMLAALRELLGTHVHQAGSNITAERLRFDFTHPERVERDILDQVEAWVNHAIQTGGEVTIETVPKTIAAEDSTVEGSFWEKYPDMVTIYTMTAPDGTLYSRELCGGPHVQNLHEITGTFKITKEESSSAGVRRIKAILS